MHLPVYRIEVFGATPNLARDLELAQFLLQDGDHLVDLGFTLPSLLDDLDGQVPVGLRFQLSETQVLELLLDFGDAQAMGQWGIDLQGFIGDEAALGLGQRVQSSHIMEAVRQLNHDDPNILRHRQKHFPETFGLAILTGRKRELGKFGHPVHQIGDLVSKDRPDLFHGGLGILDGIVQEPCGDGADIHLEFRQDRRDLHGV